MLFPILKEYQGRYSSHKKLLKASTVRSLKKREFLVVSFLINIEELNHTFRAREAVASPTLIKR